jgi:hypothetical protein
MSATWSRSSRAPPGGGGNLPAGERHRRSGAPLYVGRQSRPSSRRGAGATANGACCNGRGRPDRLRVDGRVRAAKTHTDGRTMGTSKGVEATSFSEQAPAARRIRARGSLTLRAFWRGCSRCRRRGREVHGRPPGAGGNPPAAGSSSSEWGPPLHRPDFRCGLCYLVRVTVPLMRERNRNDVGPSQV